MPAKDIMQDDEPRDSSGAAPQGGGGETVGEPAEATVAALPRVSVVGPDLLQRLAAGLAADRAPAMRPVAAEDAVVAEPEPASLQPSDPPSPGGNAGQTSPGLATGTVAGPDSRPEPSLVAAAGQAARVLAPVPRSQAVPTATEVDAEVPADDIGPGERTAETPTESTIAAVPAGAGAVAPSVAQPFGDGSPLSVAAEPDTDGLAGAPTDDLREVPTPSLPVLSTEPQSHAAQEPAGEGAPLDAEPVTVTWTAELADLLEADPVPVPQQVEQAAKDEPAAAERREETDAPASPGNAQRSSVTSNGGPPLVVPPLPDASDVVSSADTAQRHAPPPSVISEDAAAAPGAMRSNPPDTAPAWPPALPPLPPLRELVVLLPEHTGSRAAVLDDDRVPATAPSLDVVRTEATPEPPAATAPSSPFDVRPGEPWLSSATRAPAVAVAAAPAMSTTSPAAFAAVSGEAVAVPHRLPRAEVPATPTASTPASPADTARTRRGFDVRDLSRRTLRFVIIGFALWFAVSIAAIALFRFVDPPGSMLMLSHRLAGTSVDYRWVPLSAISPQVVRAVVASEDGRFCRHWGIDPREILAAIERSRNGVPRGASTITMQVAKNLFLWPSKSYVRKALEVPLTLAIELFWPKARTIEVYLNIAEWGPGVFGIEAASRYHFDKPARSLSRSEAALLAVSLPNPISRDAGDPGGGLRRLAKIIEARMLNDPGAASCVTGVGR